MSELAISYNINIITGSMPEMRDNSLHNVGYLCRRDGTREKYENSMSRPMRRAWGMQGGDVVKTFDTDCGKIGILMLRRGIS